MNEKSNFVPDRANNYNLDALIDVFVYLNTPGETFRQLLEIYFRVVNSFANNEEILTPQDCNALYTLQSIIEAVNKMQDNPETALYKIIEK